MKFDESKRWSCLTSMQDGTGSRYIRTTLKYDGEVVESKSEPTQPHEVRRSLRAKTQLVKLNDYERFIDQAIRENGDLI